MKATAPVRRCIPVTISGKTYRCDQLTIGDLSEMEAELQRRLMEIAKRNLGGFDDEDRKTLLKEAWADAQKLRVGTPEFAAAINSPWGMGYSFYLAARRQNPELTPEVAEELIAEAAMSELAKLEEAKASGVDVNPTQAATPTTTTETPQTTE